jgi:hypothetical protein
MLAPLQKSYTRTDVDSDRYENSPFGEEVEDDILADILVLVSSVTVVD